MILKTEIVESNGDTAVSRQVYSGSWELIWVLVVLVLTVRTFFFHPMSIPSASMEPNFLGRAVENTLGKEENAAPGFLRNWFRFAFYGVREIYIQAKAGGRFEVVDQKPEAFLGIFERQRFRIGAAMYTVWFPPADLWRIAGVSTGAPFAAGEDVIRLRVRSGDRMMVNRFLFDFRRPQRGESVVFESKAVPVGPKSSFYLKRLVAFEGEELRISDERKLLVDERVVVVNPSAEAGGLQTLGYLNGEQAAMEGVDGIAPLFPSETDSYVVPDKCVVVLGDNTRGSLDSRRWGGFSRKAIVGRPGLIFWPLSERFGLSPR